MLNKADRRLDRGERDDGSNPSSARHLEGADDAGDRLAPGQDTAIEGRREPGPPSPDAGRENEAVFQDEDGSYDSDGRRLLTDKQRRVIELAVEGLSDTWIAEKLGITRQTLWNWKTRDDHYRHVLEEARRQAHATASDRIRRLLLKATSVLDRHLDDQSMANQFKAAHVLLTMAGCFKPPSQCVGEDHEPEPRLGPKVG